MDIQEEMLERIQKLDALYQVEGAKNFSERDLRLLYSHKVRSLSELSRVKEPTEVQRLQLTQLEHHVKDLRQEALGLER